MATQPAAPPPPAPAAPAPGQGPPASPAPAEPEAQLQQVRRRLRKSAKALRTGALHRTYFQLMRHQCTEHQRAHQGPDRPFPPRLSLGGGSGWGSQQGTYMHNPYSFAGPQEVSPSPSLEGLDRSEEEESSETSGTDQVEECLPPDYWMLNRLAEAWLKHVAFAQ